MKAGESANKIEIVVNMRQTLKDLKEIENKYQNNDSMITAMYSYQKQEA